ncbi:L7Ae/L30e/S12e/Gadd45 family ribosomal protein [Candidatus Formimonas warabiya]|uniref:Ribosomal protein eL8/eL30/eS12/Gadd45 domain-containing protein n=1 Tax=Formimonas warabiya TaxID=1761012 RepID=A0A3G1KP14_FORW1|nr:ribosomal L7Ae/L30e/S12e/Gadd45 family protein [Candidatus Formimonas warabiya]ATW24204.1 hypothetical protein DCMF_04840 [Candidatus Formimonas warabiya]
MSHKLYALLGFAQRAGKIISGETGCASAIKQKKVFLVMVSEDASEHTKSEMKSLSRFYGVECLVWGSKLHIGTSIGKSPRATVGILDKHFADEMRKMILQVVH